ncbi:MAG: prepilin-type N-terminal cleavage/methylation domain-containing protein [Candidatus Peregrinibacteria bacterium]
MNKRGFSLMELIVAVGIASIMMVGMSVFFSSTLQNVFSTQQKVTANQGQFVTSAIINQKFGEIKALADFASDQITARNRIAGREPFTYIGINADNRLAFKDWFPFNKITNISGIMGGPLVGHSGSGEIKTIAGVTIVRQLPENFGGFTKLAGLYYVVIPHENRIIQCTDTQNNCVGTGVPPTFALTNADGSAYQLSTPMDIATDGTDLFISDAGHGKILKTTKTGAVEVLADGLNFPTGLAYDTGVLYFSETFSNQVKKIDLATGDISVVAGQGNTGTCETTARYCDLNLPTGLFILSSPMIKQFYIADSGNNRVLKVSDPGHPTAAYLTFNTGKTPRPIKKLVVSFPAGVDASGGSLDDMSVLNTNGNRIFSANAFEYQLFSPLAEDTVITNACDTPGCTPTTTKIRPENMALFIVGDNVYLNGDAKNPLIVNGEKTAYLQTSEFTADYNAGESVVLGNDVPADTEMAFEFSGLDTDGVSDTYSLIEIRGYGPTSDAADNPFFTRYVSLTVGDGILGTADDKVEIVNEGWGVPLDFPTGASNAYIANTGGRNLIKIADKSAAIFTPWDGSAFNAFDYSSDFTVSGLAFEKLHNDKILQMTIKTDTGETFKLNTPLE